MRCEQETGANLVPASVVSLELIDGARLDLLPATYILDGRETTAQANMNDRYQSSQDDSTCIFRHS